MSYDTSISSTVRCFYNTIKYIPISNTTMLWATQARWYPIPLPPGLAMECLFWIVWRKFTMVWCYYSMSLYHEHSMDFTVCGLYELGGTALNFFHFSTKFCCLAMKFCFLCCTCNSFSITLNIFAFVPNATQQNAWKGIWYVLGVLMGLSC